MHAAVVHRFDRPPCYGEWPDPTPATGHEVVVDVLAAGLHPRVRSQADGSHYASTAELPLVPGVDGVGRLPDGRQVYFVLPDVALGAMAERTVVDLRRTVPLPDDADPVLLAAAMNPAMSSWVGLRRRVTLPPDARVLVLGATGHAGRLAVQIARELGASYVVGAGRDPGRLALLPGLGADATVSLDGEPETVAAQLAEAAAEVDVVVDYLWGAPAASAMAALVTARPDRSRPLCWLEVGSMAGATAAVPSAALRAADLRLLGSGQGSVPTAGFLAELPALAERISAGRFHVDVAPVPLADVESAWTAPEPSGRRVVLTP